MSSSPGDHNDVVLCGVVLQTHVVRHHISGILVKVRVTDDDPLVIVVVPPTPLLVGSIERGCRVWIRGYLCADPEPSRKALHYVQARHLDVVKKSNSTAMMAG